jgi:hypothetical protein
MIIIAAGRGEPPRCAQRFPRQLDLAGIPADIGREDGAAGAVSHLEPA